GPPMIQSITVVANEVALTFLADANRGYTLEFTEALGAPWQTLTRFEPRTTNHTATVTDTRAPAKRFYRLQTH
ncbi:MAG TPA: hypothetical protein VN673_06675, partial [Clostridia bacterium]|nr:hypothetical protein [Clostridia bacterium]